MAKAASVVYGLGCLLLIFEFGDSGVVLPSAILVTSGIIAVWFASELGGWLGPTGLGILRVQRPALWVQRIGWGLLVLAAVVGSL